MVQKDLHTILTVPELDEQRSGIRAPFARDPLGLFRVAGPAVLVAAGVGATLAWMGFLGWTTFEVLRWALG